MCIRDSYLPVKVPLQTHFLSGFLLHWKHSDDPDPVSYTHLIKARPNKWHENDCPFCHKSCPAYDKHSSRPTTWRGLDWGGILVEVEYQTHRIICLEHGVYVAEVPWAYPGSRFTKDFDQMCIRDRLYGTATQTISSDFGSVSTLTALSKTSTALITSKVCSFKLIAASCFLSLIHILNERAVW